MYTHTQNLKRKEIRIQPFYFAWDSIQSVFLFVTKVAWSRALDG